MEGAPISRGDRLGRGAGGLATRAGVAALAGRFRPAFGLVVGCVLAGCGPAAPAPTSAVAAPMATVQGALAVPADAPPSAAAAGPTVAAVPFELLGTSVEADATHTFAVLKQSGGRLFTAHAGDAIDGFTIARIEADRVQVRGPDESLTELPTANQARIVAAPVAAADAGRARLITNNVNTDQSIPTNAVLGPTGYDPDNGRQMGH